MKTKMPDAQMIAAARVQADAAGLAQTIYRTADPLAMWGIWEATNPKPRIARDGYETFPVVTLLPTRYFVGAMVPYVDVSVIHEYGLTQKLSNSIRVF